MRSKFPFAFFTLMMVMLGISFVVTYHYLEQKKQEMSNEDVLGTATQSELTMDSKIDYIHKNSDGSQEIKYIYTISNLSPTYRIKNVLSQSNLQETFSPYEYQVESLSSNFASNPSYNGTTDTQLLAPGNVLDIAQNQTIALIVKFYPQASKGPFENKVAAQGDIDLPPTQGSNGGTTGNVTAGGSTSVTPPSSTTGGTTPNPAPAPTPTPTPVPQPTPTPTPPPAPKPQPQPAPAPVINFTGLMGTSATNFVGNVKICYNCGLRLVWNVPNQTNCVRSALPPTSQWQGTQSSVQDRKDIQKMTVNTVFTLTCSGGTYNVNLTVGAPKPPPAPAPTPAPTPVPPTQGGSTGNGSAGNSTDGNAGQASGGSTGGIQPSVAAAAKIAFTLPDDEQILSISNVTPDDATGAQTSIDITPLVKTQVLPNTDLLPFHTGILANLREWITDNVLGEQRNKIVIDKIGVNGEINEGSTEGTLNEGFWRMPGTSTPELGGNTVIAGHRFDYTYGPLTFHNLNKLNVDDEIKVIWFGKTYVYKIQSLKIVQSDNIAPIENTDANTLTLITCTSLTDSSQRLIVTAVLE